MNDILKGFSDLTIGKNLPHSKGNLHNDCRALSESENIVLCNFAKRMYYALRRAMQDGGISPVNMDVLVSYK